MTASSTKSKKHRRRPAAPKASSALQVRVEALYPGASVHRWWLLRADGSEILRDLAPDVATAKQRAGSALKSFSARNGT